MPFGCSHKKPFHLKSAKSQCQSAPAGVTNNINDETASLVFTPVLMSKWLPGKRQSSSLAVASLLLLAIATQKNTPLSIFLLFIEETVVKI